MYPLNRRTKPWSRFYTMSAKRSPIRQKLPPQPKYFSGSWVMNATQSNAISRIEVDVFQIEYPTVQNYWSIDIVHDIGFCILFTSYVGYTMLVSSYLRLNFDKLTITDIAHCAGLIDCTSYVEKWNTVNRIAAETGIPWRTDMLGVNCVTCEMESQSTKCIHT